MMKGFVEFIRKQGVIGLAIGFIIGVAVGGVVKSLVTDLINPLVGLVFQTSNLNSLTFTINKATFNYGNFLGVLIDFVIVLAVIYLVFKVAGLEKLDLPEDDEE